MSVVTTTERAAWFRAAKGVTLTSAVTQFLDLIQPWVEQVVAQVVGCPAESAEYTEYLPTQANARAVLEYGIDIGFDVVGGVVIARNRTDQIGAAVQLSNTPVRAVTSVYENLAAWATGDPAGNWPAASLLPATAYRLDLTEPGLSRSGQLVRVVGGWATAPRCVKVTYTGGWTGAELGTGRAAPVKMAVLLGLGWWLGKAMRVSRSTGSDGLSAMQLSVRDFSVTLGDPAMFGQGDGAWAQNVLGPDALNLLSKHLSLAQYFS